MTRLRPTLPLLAAATLLGCGGSNLPPSPDGGDTPPSLEIQTAQGKVKGSLDGAVRVFLGLPFAAPPVGDNRFKPPRPAASWNGVREANAYGPQCPQFNQGSGLFDEKASEDCLTLNVWSPAAKGAPRPVMVWIHGGAFILGSGSEPTYQGRNLAEAGDVVVVTVNYRLGPLGFLAHPALTTEDGARPSSGNYGILDQQAALAWVKANIAAFGGDPGNVTLFGESAGGMSVCAQLVAPGAKGLYHRAIDQSGPCLAFPLPSRAIWEAQGEALAKAAGCAGDAAAIRACLRKKTPKEILTALPRRLELIFGEGASWTPHLDGVVLPEQTSAALKAGQGAKVPLLIGANRDEGKLFLALGAKVDTEMQLRAALGSLYPPAVTDKIIAFYKPKAPTPKDQALAALNDAFVCDARRVARLHEAAGQSVFYYHFSRPFKWIFPDLGAFHSAEIPFIFDNPYVFISITEEDRPLAKAMQGYWTRFARAGNPNPDPLRNTIQWPAYRAAGDTHLGLDLTIATGTGLRKEACDFWDGLLP